MARRVKSDKTIQPITGWDQADKIIKQIGDLQLKINAAEAKANDDIKEAKQELQDTTKTLYENIEQLRLSLEAFAVAHKDEFGKDRSRKLNFGRLGWRKSTSIIIKKTTLRLIKEMFTRVRAAACIRVKEAVDKEALAKLTDEELAYVRARRKEKDVFFVEPDLPEAVDYCE